MAALEKSVFFERMEWQGLALTYDDVGTVPCMSDVDYREVDLVSRFSKNVELKIPIVSAAMDTVTTAPMAIALAKMGGIGVIHAGLSPEDQRAEVRKVKLHLNGLIEKPITVDETRSLQDVLETCEREGYEFRTFPVTGEGGKLVGLLTQNDFELCESVSDPVSKAMTPFEGMIVADADTSVAQAHELMRTHKKKTLPLVHSDGTVAGLYVASDVNRVMHDSASAYNVDKDSRLRVAAAIPTGEGALRRIAGMIKYLDVAVIDTSRGDAGHVFETLKQIKENFSGLDVVVGNISNGESALALAEQGADGIKVGQGPGSICTTRIQTGIRVPQVTAVYDCYQAVRNMGVPVCADGGITNPGDIPIALAAGASSVMMGRMLAGTDESPGGVIPLPGGGRGKVYRGMGSEAAMRDSEAARERYGGDQPRPEGVDARVTYQGSVIGLLQGYVEYLRKGMALVGAPNIEAHQRHTKFYRITNAGMRESHPHDVIVMSE